MLKTQICVTRPQCVKTLFLHTALFMLCPTARNSLLTPCSIITYSLVSIHCILLYRLQRVHHSDGLCCISKWLTRPLVTKLQSLDSLYLTSNMCPCLQRNHILYNFHGNIPHFIKKVFIFIIGKGKFTVSLHTQLFQLFDSTNHVQISVIMNIKYAYLRA